MTKITGSLFYFFSSIQNYTIAG